MKNELSDNRCNPPVSNLDLPLEMEYADDVDFLDEEKKPLDHLEFSHIYLAEAMGIDLHDKSP